MPVSISPVVTGYLVVFSGGKSVGENHVLFPCKWLSSLLGHSWKESWTSLQPSLFAYLISAAILLLFWVKKNLKTSNIILYAIFFTKRQDVYPRCHWILRGAHLQWAELELLEPAICLHVECSWSCVWSGSLIIWSQCIEWTIIKSGNHEYSTNLFIHFFILYLIWFSEKTCLVIYEAH